VHGRSIGITLQKAGLHNLYPDVTERAELNIDIDGGLMHFVTGHGPCKLKLKELQLVENNQCHKCGTVATPEHVVIQCAETQDILEEQRTRLEGTPTTEVLKGHDLI